MDYSHIISELRKASLFDLFRLRAAIDRELDDPARIAPVRARLRPGMTITFFNETTNRLETATILELHRTHLTVHKHGDPRPWSIRFCTVNIDDVDTDVRSHARPAGVDRNQLKVGDPVAFTPQDGRIRFGTVVRLNQKTATVETTDGPVWRVAYQLLSPVIEG